MSTIVVVKKAGKVCIAADSLTSFGDLRLSSEYDAAHDKILKYGRNHLGIVGSAAHQLVMESILSDKKIKLISLRVWLFLKPSGLCILC